MAFQSEHGMRHRVGGQAEAVRRWGPAAIVTLAAAAALRAFCEGRLAPFKQPRRVAVVDALPRTPATGQVQRTLIIERLVAEI